MAAEIIPPDRRIDWSPGIPGGLPSYPVAINVKDGPYLAKGDGVADNGGHSKSNRRLPRQEGRVPAKGTYRTTSGLEIKPKRLSARRRPDETRIKCHGADGSIISASGSGGSGFTSVKGGFEKDSTHITVGDAAGFNVGDYVEILQDNDPAVCEGLYDYMVRAIGQTMKVVAKNGRTLTVNRPSISATIPRLAAASTRGKCTT